MSRKRSNNKKRKNPANLPVPRRGSIAHFSRFATKGAKIPDKFRAAVALNHDGKPAWFLFDVFAFWDFVCRINEKMYEELPESVYDRIDTVSLGPLIDKLESGWTFSEEHKAEAKREYERALAEIEKGNVHPL